MAEKILQTRIQLKYDVWAEWEKVKGTFTPKAGEVCIVEIPADTNAGQSVAEPVVLMKVGDGKTLFGALPWLQALAADVHTWAKKSETEFTAWVKDLVTVDDIDLSNYYNKNEVDAKVKTATDAAGTAKGIADGAVSRLDVLEPKVDVDSVTGHVAAEIAKLAVTDTAVTGKYVSAVSEAGGKITVSREDLPTYALTTGGANGTVAFNGADVAVKGLGSAAYEAKTAFDEAGAAAAVLGQAGDSATTATVHGALTAAAEALAKGNKGIEDAAAALAKANEKTTMADVEAKNYATKSEAQGYADAKDAAIKAAKDAADAAQADIDAFLKTAETDDGVINTLKEIQAALDSGEQSAGSLLAEINKIKDGTTVVPKATHAAEADSAADSAKLGGTAAADFLKKTDAPGYADILTKTAAQTAYQPKGEYASAAQGAKADTALQPAALNDYYTKAQADAAFMDATETGNAIDAKIVALNLGTTYEPIGAETRAKAYADGLAGNYATATQGTKADTAVQQIETTANGGLKVTGKNKIDIDESVLFIFDCGTASKNV